MEEKLTAPADFLTSGVASKHMRRYQYYAGSV